MLAIGGLKEKLLAAVRGGIKTALIPSENKKDLVDIPDNIKEALTIIPVDMVDEVLLHALVEKTVPLENNEESESISHSVSDADDDVVTTH